MAEAPYSRTSTYTDSPLHRLAVPRGLITLHIAASIDFLDHLAIDSGIHSFYRKGEQQHELLRRIAAEPDGYVSVAVADNTIVGFLLLCQPGKIERWSNVPGLYEMGLEVSRNWRELGLAHRLLLLTFADPIWETRIAVAQGYHWHWDIEETGLSIWEYRETFRGLLEVYGFALFDTDDPEIKGDDANILLARLGSHCDKALLRAFYEDLFRTGKRPEWLSRLMLAA